MQKIKNNWNNKNCNITKNTRTYQIGQHKEQRHGIQTMKENERNKEVELNATGFSVYFEADIIEEQMHWMYSANTAK